MIATGEIAGQSLFARYLEILDAAEHDVQRRAGSEAIPAIVRGDLIVRGGVAGSSLYGSSSLRNG